MESRHFDLPGITVNMSMFFYLEHLAAPTGIEYSFTEPSNEKPAATVSQRASFNGTARKSGGGLAFSGWVRR
jgi:hypothetical protein